MSEVIQLISHLLFYPQHQPLQNPLKNQPIIPIIFLIIDYNLNHNNLRVFSTKHEPETFDSKILKHASRRDEYTQQENDGDDHDSEGHGRQ